MNVEEITIESDDRGFELYLLTTDEGRMVFNIQAVAVDLHRAVIDEIGPWISEMLDAHNEYRAGISGDPLLQGVLDRIKGMDAEDAALEVEGLKMAPRENAEGLVVRYLDHDLPMVKIKQEDYVALHRIVTGLSERVVWERLGAGETVEDICKGLPDEFARWVVDVRVGLQFEADRIYYEACEAYDAIMYGLKFSSSAPGGALYTRKDFALEVQNPTYADVRPYLYMLVDGKDIRPAIWRSLKPVGLGGVGRRLLTVSEDTG